MNLGEFFTFSPNVVGIERLVSSNIDIANGSQPTYDFEPVPTSIPVLDSEESFISKLITIYKDQSKKWTTFALAFLRLVFFIQSHLIYAACKILLLIDLIKLCLAAYFAFMGMLPLMLVGSAIYQTNIGKQVADACLKRAEIIGNNQFKITTYLYTPYVLVVAGLLLFGALPASSLLGALFVVPTVVSVITGVGATLWSDRGNIVIEKFLKFIGLRNMDDGRELEYADESKSETLEITTKRIAQGVGAIGAYTAATMVGVPMTGIIIPAVITAAGTIGGEECLQAGKACLTAYHNYMNANVKDAAVSVEKHNVATPTSSRLNIQ